MYSSGHTPYQAESPRYYALRETAGYCPEKLKQRLGAEQGHEPPCAGKAGFAEAAPAAHFFRAAFGNVDLTTLTRLCSGNSSSYAIVRKEDSRSVLRDSDGASPHAGQNPLLAIIPPKSSADCSGGLSMTSHDGRKLIHLADGRLEVAMRDKVEILNPGDSIYLNSRIPHALCGLDGGSAISIIIIIS